MASDKTNTIHTDKFQYVRIGDVTWEQKELPPVPQDKFAPLAPDTVKEKKKK